MGWRVKRGLIGGGWTSGYVLCRMVRGSIPMTGSPPPHRGDARPALAEGSGFPSDDDAEFN